MRLVALPARRGRVAIVALAGAAFVVGICLTRPAISQFSNLELVVGTRAQTRSPNAQRSIGASSPQLPTSAKIGETIVDCAGCPEMVRIPALKPGENLFVGKFEITWHQYLFGAAQAGCGMPWIDYRQYDPKISPLDDNYPVVGVSLEQIRCYSGWLRKKSGKDYRLPSAEEWEHFTRAGTRTEYYWGDGIGFNNAAIDNDFDVNEIWRRFGHPTDREQRFSVKWGSVVPVGSFSPNPWGLYDTVGNAIEATTELLPPNPNCVRQLGAVKCAIYAGRGNGINLDFTSPSGRKLTAVTGRAPVGRAGGGLRSGFRLVRH